MKVIITENQHRLLRRVQEIEHLIEPMMDLVYEYMKNGNPSPLNMFHYDMFIDFTTLKITKEIVNRTNFKGDDKIELETQIQRFIETEYIDMIRHYFYSRMIKDRNINESYDKRILKETLESKWNKGNYDYQHGYCHYFAYDIIGKIKKRFPDKKVNYYMILANEVDKYDGTIVQDYLIHVYIQIDNMLLNSNGITTHDKAWEMAEEWEQRQAHLVPESYETKMWDEESDTIPEMFFNNSFCNTGRVKKDVEEFLNNPIVQRILRYK